MGKGREFIRLSRIHRAARTLAHRAEFHEYLRERDGKEVGKVPFKRKVRKQRKRVMIAYDLETTRIEAGTPTPLYITAHGAQFRYSGPIESLDHLADILETNFLTDHNKGARFIGWNANRFDVYFIGAALLRRPGYTLRPYLTRSKSLRGMRIVRDDDGARWEFLDGLSMTGLETAPKLRKLKHFVGMFAPGFPKMELDFETTTFDASDARHVAYAERDSEALYVAIHNVDNIVRDTFGVGLNPTIGNTGIRIFQAHMPEGVLCWEPLLPALTAIREQVLRGGYCYCARKHEGPIWKYDLNQAYAAAMRETPLPGGRCYRTDVYVADVCAIYRITATKKGNAVPFYYRSSATQTAMGFDDITDTWITSSEYEQLASEGWQIDVTDAWVWTDKFLMREYVDNLERLRMGADGGPNGPLGTVVKCLGNNSFGKTLERIDGIELVLSLEQPEDFHYYGNDDGTLQHVWYRLGEPLKRDYHQPQIGAFITAHVRMVVRRAALQAPKNFLYADTDCVVFDRPVDLPIDPKRYGMWKVECEGEPYRIITKKVYASFDATTKHAKGLHVGKLTADDFRAWYRGVAPRQIQVQRMNFLKVMSGASMFQDRAKVGQRTP